MFCVLRSTAVYTTDDTHTNQARKSRNYIPYIYTNIVCDGGRVAGCSYFCLHIEFRVYNYNVHIHIYIEYDAPSHTFLNNVNRLLSTLSVIVRCVLVFIVCEWRWRRVLSRD